jgi:hypothetical protein
MKKTKLKVTTLLFLLVCGTSAFSQEMPKFSNPEEKEAWIKAHPVEFEEIITKEKNPSQAKEMDFWDLPVLVNTGNPTIDAENYQIAKSKWIAEHPDLYPKSDEEAPELKITPSSASSPGFPKYMDTGNPTIDAENYQIAKSKWIAEHPDLYPKSEVEVPEQKITPSIANLPGFPKFIDTGNPDEDYARYQEAKVSWYADNQENVEEFYRMNVPTSTQQIKP